MVPQPMGAPGARFKEAATLKVVAVIWRGAVRWPQGPQTVPAGRGGRGHVSHCNICLLMLRASESTGGRHSDNSRCDDKLQLAHVATSSSLGASVFTSVKWR